MSCESHLDYFKSALARGDDAWAVELLTSWLQFTSHPSPENLSRFGPFSECMNFRRNTSQGQYCLISYSSILWSESDETTDVVEDDSSFAARDVMIFRNGICLPASCTTQQAGDFVKNLLAETNFVVVNVFCQKKHEQQPNPIDFLFLTLVTLFISLALYSTFIDLRAKGKSINKYLQSFSLTHNFKSLFTPHDQASSIDCIDGIKVICAIWIIVGHRMDMMVEHPHQMKLLMSREERAILRAAEMFTTIVDAFFVVSGVLVTRKCLQLFNERRFCYWKFCLTRFVRFASSLSLIFMFFMSSLPGRLVNGPQVSEMEEEREDCRKSWLGSLLLLGNFYENPCLRHTWYTSVDFQLFIISPPTIIYGLFKFGRKFLKIIAFIVLLGQINIYKLSINSNAAEAGMEDEEFYYETRYRFMPWFVGVSTGYIMQINERNSLGKNLRLLGWTVSLTALIALEFLRTMFHQHHVSAALYAASHRTVYSCAIAWIIYACHNHHLQSAGGGGTFLSHRYWRPLSKMCLSIYLVHYLNVLLSFVNMKQPYQFGVFWLVKILAADVLLSLVCSFLFFMLVESPLAKLAKTLLA